MSLKSLMFILCFGMFIQSIRGQTGGTLSNFIYNPDSFNTVYGTAGNSATPTITNGGGAVSYSIVSAGVLGYLD